MAAGDFNAARCHRRADVRVGADTSDGTWAQAPTSYTYAWLRGSGRDLTPIVGATARTYTLTAADIGHLIRSQVTPINSAGGARASSGPVGPITT